MLRILSKKWWLRCWLPLIITGSFLIFFCNYKVHKNAEDRTYSSTQQIPYNRVGLLLGTCKYISDNKTINPFWLHRLNATIKLWKAHKISRILISGDNGWFGYNEPQDFQDSLLASGIPDSVIYCDFAGFRTHDSVIRCKKVFGQSSVTIISQEFHNERALFIADRYGLKAVGFNAKAVAVSASKYNTVREALARVKLFFDLYVLHTKPHFLGKQVKIN